MQWDIIDPISENAIQITTRLVSGFEFIDDSDIRAMVAVLKDRGVFKGDLWGRKLEDSVVWNPQNAALVTGDTGPKINN